MKQTKKELNTELIQSIKELDILKDKWMDDPEYKKYSNLAFEAKLKAKQQFAGGIKSLQEKISLIKEQLKPKEKVTYILPDNLERLRKEMIRGVDYGPKGLVPVMSWGNDFMLLKKPGHSSWVARGESAYLGTEYTLHDMRNITTANFDVYYKSQLFCKDKINTKKAIEISETILKEMGII